MLSLLICSVIGVTDGDTLRVTCPADGYQQTLTLRLSGIDAPEKGQPWGDRSRQHLRELCLRRSAEVAIETQDRWGRQVAQVRCEGVDAGEAQLRAGMAWIYERYVHDDHLEPLQSVARAERRGLWADPAPLPPWEWRAAHRARR